MLGDIANMLDGVRIPAFYLDSIVKYWSDETTVS